MAVEGNVALDVGCGPGNLLGPLATRAERVVGVDLSAASVRLARQRFSKATVAVIRADALALPIGDRTVQVAVASGSLHHTGDAKSGLLEVERVLASGGAAFVSLYRENSYYHWMYRSVGKLARWSARRRLTDTLVNNLILLPAFALYFVVGRVIVHRSASRPSFTHVRNYFADQLLNPVVGFQTEGEVRQWVRETSLTVTDVCRSHAGALLNVGLRKS